MVLASELPTDLRKRSLGQVLGQIHGDLPRIDDGARIILCLDLCQPKSELLRHGFLDRLDRYLTRLRVNKVLEYLLRVRKSDIGTDQGRVCHQADQRAFQLSDV